MVRKTSLNFFLTVATLLIAPVCAIQAQPTAAAPSERNMEVPSVLTMKTLVVQGWSFDVIATVVGQGYSVNVTSVIANEGDEREVTNLTFQANSTILCTKEIALESGTNTTLVFRWETAGFPRGRYVLNASVTPVPGENETSDNTATFTMKIAIPGDVNGDGEVDIYDAIIFCGSLTPPWVLPPQWPPPHYDSDINSDGCADIFDALILAGHFGQKDPLIPG